MRCQLLLLLPPFVRLICALQLFNGGDNFYIQSMRRNVSFASVEKSLSMLGQNELAREGKGEIYSNKSPKRVY